MKIFIDNVLVSFLYYYLFTNVHIFNGRINEKSILYHIKQYFRRFIRNKKWTMKL